MVRVRIEELFKDDFSDKSEKSADNIPAFSDEMKERIYSRIQRKQAFQQCECSYNESISSVETNRKTVLGKCFDIAASVAESVRKIVSFIPKETAKMSRRAANNTKVYLEEVQVDSVEIYHIPVWRKICSAALTLVIAVGPVAGGKCYYSQLKGIRITETGEESYTESSCVENIFTPETVIDDYK